MGGTLGGAGGVFVAVPVVAVAYRAFEELRLAHDAAAQEEIVAPAGIEAPMLAAR